MECGVENKVGGALGVSNQPQGLWVPPWGWVLLAAVFHQILRKDPGEEATGHGTATCPPSGLTASPDQGPSQGGWGTSPRRVGSTVLLRVQRRLWGCLARDETVLSHRPDLQGEAAGS